MKLTVYSDHSGHSVCEPPIDSAYWYFHSNWIRNYYFRN